MSIRMVMIGIGLMASVAASGADLGEQSAPGDNQRTGCIECDARINGKREPASVVVTEEEKEQTKSGVAEITKSNE